MKHHLQSMWKFVACAALVGVADAWAAPAPPAWKVGVASGRITPETNMWMAGYASRTNASTGVKQELFAKALALEDDHGSKLVMVTLDLIGVPRSLRKNLERRAQEAWQLPPESLLLNASHTHSGPEFRVGRAPADDGEFKPTSLGQRYGAALEEKLFRLIGAALSNRAPARLIYSHARCGFAMNRRLPTERGYQNSPNPDGPVDHDVPVLRAVGTNGQTRAILFGYSCHNTTLALYQFCGDYAGYAQEFLQAANPGTTALFLNGCSGDQNPYPRGTFELAQQHGRTLATAVEAAMGVQRQRELNGPLRAAIAEIDLDYSRPPSREEFQRRLGSKNQTEAQHARRMLDRLDRDGELPGSYPYPVQVVHFGNELILVALGGEVVVDYSLRLKKELAGPIVWIAGYSNDVMGYIPSRRVREEGGYEAEGAMLYSPTHPAPWAPSLEQRIVSKVHELHRRLKAE
ncbi:MAG: neutral/alkaline non-lysosomal ceramidase N-terminal domain-containing protein [Verrucomicrobia bacterium]|nr:neutral/alkaline non-lysosomal ceramidase N-terminal domain-containing protein [Verrucomicrobiota bacterium]